MSVILIVDIFLLRMKRAGSQKAALNFKCAVHRLFTGYVMCKARLIKLSVNEGVGFFLVYSFDLCALLFLKVLMAGTSVSATKVITGQIFLFVGFS